MDPQIRVGIDVGCKAHRVGIADPKGSILEEFDISHTNAGFQDFFRRIDHHKRELDLPVAVAMWGFTGHVRPEPVFWPQATLSCTMATRVMKCA